MFLDTETSRLTGSHDDGVSDEGRIRTWYDSRGEQDDRLDLAVVELATGNVVGEAVLNEWDPGNESCSFRICLVPGTYGSGLGTEATRLIVEYGFEKLGCTASRWRSMRSIREPAALTRRWGSSPRAYCVTRCSGRASGWTRR